MSSLVVKNGRLNFQDTLVPVTAKSQLGCLDSVVSRCLGGWKDLTVDDCQIVYVRLRQLRSYLGDLLNDIDPKLHSHALFSTAVKVYLAVKMKIPVESKDIGDLLSIHVSTRMIKGLIKRDPNIFLLLPDEMKADRNFILDCIEANHLVFNFISDDLKRADDFVVQAVIKNYLVFEVLGERYATSNPIIMLVLSMEPAYYRKLSAELRDDPELIEKYLDLNDGIIYLHLSDELKASYDFAKLAVSRNGLVIKYFPSGWRNDPVLAKLAVQQNACAYDFLGKKCQTDDTIIVEATRQDDQLYEKLPRSKRSDFDLIFRLLKENFEVFSHLPQNLKASENFLRKALTINGRIYELLTPQQRKNKVYACLAYENDPEVIEGFEPEVLADVRVLKLLYILNPIVMGKYLDSKFTLEHLNVRNLAMERVSIKMRVLMLIASLFNHELKDFCMDIYVKTLEFSENYIKNLEVLVGSRRCAGLSIMLFCSIDKSMLPEEFYLQHGKIFDVFLHEHRNELLKLNSEFYILHLMFLKAVIQSNVDSDRKIALINRLCTKNYLDSMKALNQIIAILELKQFERLEFSHLDEGDLNEIFISSMIEGGFITEDQIEAFESEFLTCRNSSLFFRFVSRFYDKIEGKKDLKAFIKAVVEGNLNEKRIIRESEHFKAIDPEVIKKWVEPASQLFLFENGTQMVMEDTDAWQDLLFFGTDTQYPYFNLEENHIFLKAVFSLLMDGKNRLFMIRDTEKKIISGALVKLLLDENDEPVMFLERTLPFSSPYSKYILEFAKHNATYKGLRLYVAGGHELLHSYSSNASYDFYEGSDSVSPYGYAFCAEHLPITFNLDVGSNTEV